MRVIKNFVTGFHGNWHAYVGIGLLLIVGALLFCRPHSLKAHVSVDAKDLSAKREAILAEARRDASSKGNPNTRKDQSAKEPLIPDGRVPSVTPSAKLTPPASTPEPKETSHVKRGGPQGIPQPTLGDLSRMRSQRQLMEQELKIVELQHRIEELTRPAAPVVLATPRRDGIDLPELTPPKSGSPVSIDSGKSRRRGPVVVSVQGSGGKLSATIRNTDGTTVTVHNGASYNGGILRVSRSGVEVVRRDGRKNRIPFE